MENLPLGQDVKNRGRSGESALEQGCALFNGGDFFHAHEVWEDWWRATTRPEKRTIQGMIQIAVAMYHATTENFTGAASVMKRGLQNLEGAGDDWRGLDLNRLRRDATRMMESWKAKQACVPFQIVRNRSGDA